MGAPDISKKTATKTGDEWIDRYVHEVGRRLPVNQRSDVQREIRSLIEDEVAGRLDAQTKDDTATPDRDATVLAVLDTFGAPEEMAARYHAPRYLIGPALFPIYRLVLGIVLAITFGSYFLGLAIDAATGPTDSLLDTLFGLMAGLIQAVGTLTLIFAILEYLGVGAQSKPEVWTALNLPPIKDPNRVSVAETAVDIAFTAAVIVFANFYLNRGTGVLYFNGGWQTIALFSPEFLQYIPWLTVIWSVDILVNIVLLARGRWEPVTHLATMLTAAATAFVAYRMISGGPLAAWEPLEPAFKVTAVIILSFSLFEVGKQAWLLFRSSGWKNSSLQSQHVA